MDQVEAIRAAVVIPVYRAHYLAECLGSVFGQTRPADEVIVVDDGSPDGEAIESALTPYAGRVTVICQENRGAGAARNKGILAAQADAIAFLDADDVWEPQCLERQLHLLTETPGRTLVYANAHYVGDGPLSGQLFMDTAWSKGEATVEALLSQRCTVLTSSVVVRRQALIDEGLFDEELRRGQDFDMWLRLAAAGARFAYTTTPLVQRRIHSQNLSGDRISELERAAAVLVKLPAKLQLTDDQANLLEQRVRQLRGEIATEQGKQTLAAGALSEAATHFREAVRSGAGWKSRLMHLALKIAPSTTRHAYLRVRGASGHTPATTS
jgi:glycosyltransferase involved in cell wall biosynthesis